MNELQPDLVMNAIDNKRELVGLEQLNVAEQVMTLLSYARFEIELGGLDALFESNHTRNYVSATIRAFEEIGAMQVAKLIQQAEELRARGNLTDVESAERNDLFWQCWLQGNPGVDDLILRFVQQHQHKLPKP